MKIKELIEELTKLGVESEAGSTAENCLFLLQEAVCYYDKKIQETNGKAD